MGQVPIPRPPPATEEDKVNEENQRLTASVSKISPKVFISFIKYLGTKPNAAVAIEA